MYAYCGNNPVFSSDYGSVSDFLTSPFFKGGDYILQSIAGCNSDYELVSLCTSFKGTRYRVLQNGGICSIERLNVDVEFTL